MWQQWYVAGKLREPERLGPRQPHRLPPAQPRAAATTLVRAAGRTLRRLGEGLESWATPSIPDGEPAPVRVREDR